MNVRDKQWRKPSMKQMTCTKWKFRFWKNIIKKTCRFLQWLAYHLFFIYLDVVKLVKKTKNKKLWQGNGRKKKTHHMCNLGVSRLVGRSRVFIEEMPGAGESLWHSDANLHEAPRHEGATPACPTPHLWSRLSCSHCPSSGSSNVKDPSPQTSGSHSFPLQRLCQSVFPALHQTSLAKGSLTHGSAPPSRPYTWYLVLFHRSHHPALV